MAITIYDIAREAKLSHAAVSMALRGIPGISEATRNRVQSLANQMGYRPNASARNLKSPETRMISAVFPLGQRASMQIITQFQNECEARGYQVLLQNLPPDPGNCRRMLEYLCKGYSDAAMMMLYDFEPVEDLIRTYLHSGRPIVLFGAPVDTRAISNLLPIEIDNLPAVRQVTEMLIARGHRHIVHIRPAAPSIGDERVHQVIVETMCRHGITEVNPAYHFDFRQTGDHFVDGYNCGDRLLADRPEATALQCPDDIFAFGIMRRLIELGKRIPEDISIVGSNNTPDGDYSLIRLTSIDLKYREAMMLSCRLLYEQLTEHNWPDPPSVLKLEAEVVMRESTGPAPPRN